MDTGFLAIAFLVGAVAVFNPCGFALLPAYLSVLTTRALSGENKKDSFFDSTIVPFGKVLRFSAGMTVGFLLIFTLFGFLFTTGATFFATNPWVLPIFSLTVGIILVGLGIRALVFGKMVGLKSLSIKGVAPTKGFFTEVGYGLTFAFASLSCTIGPFLVVLGGLFVGNGGVEGILSFVAYALGMGFVVLLLGLAMITISGSGQFIRRHINIATKISGMFFIFAGIYVMLFSIVEVSILYQNFGIEDEDTLFSGLLAFFSSVVDAVGTMQSSIVSFFETISWIGFFAFFVALFVLFLMINTLKHIYNKDKINKSG